MESEKCLGRRQQGQQPEEGISKNSRHERELTGEVWKPGSWTPLRKTCPQGPTLETALTTNSAKDATVRKRHPNDEPGSAPDTRIRLQDHIPQSLVFDCKARDARSLKLSGFQHQVTVEEVKLICEGAVQIRHRFGHGCKLLSSIAQYESEQKAVEATVTLKTARLRGCSFNVFHCGARWNHPKHHPKVLNDTLSLHGVPEEFYSKAKLGTSFPTGHVDVLLDGTIQVKFPSASELIKAVKDPMCWTIGGEQIQFALALAKKKGAVRSKRKEEERHENKESSLPTVGCSLGAQLKALLISQTASRN